METKMLLPALVNVSHRVSISELGGLDIKVDTVEEARAIVRKRHKGAKIGRWSTWKAYEDYGKRGYYSVAKWYAPGDTAYTGLLIRTSEVL